MPVVHYASTKDSDMSYLVRADIHDPFFYIDTGHEKLIFLNNLEIDAFTERNQNALLKAIPVEPLLKEVRALPGDTAVSNKLALHLCKKYGLVHVPVAVSKHMPLDMADYLRQNKVILMVANSFIPEREQKSPEEVEHIRESLRRTHMAFECIEEILHTSIIKDDALHYQGEILTSEYMKKRVDTILFEQGMENSEGLILSCGPQAALPHHRGSGPLRQNQTIVCDIFPRSRTTKYFADMTRTYVKGAPTKQVQKMYEAVKEAQDQAIVAIKPGVCAKDIYDISAQVIRDAGFSVGEKGFTHGLGHGLGLDVHEAPVLNQYAKAILKAGNVVTVEPGLYYPEWGGVRLEDVVVVTKNGCENLTNYKRELIIP